MRRAYLFLVVLIFGCSEKTETTDSVIARIKTHQIQLEDFREFYELDPQFPPDSSGTNALRDELLKLAAQYILYDQAGEQGLLNSEIMQTAHQWELNQATLREFYRENISRKIEITEEELRKAFLFSETRVHVRQLFTENFEQAQNLYQSLLADTNFQRLAPTVFTDSLLRKSGGDLGWIALGELDDEFSTAVSKLKKQEISRPVKTRWGYHIIQLLDKKIPAILNETKFSEKRSALTKILKRRKSQDKARLFVANYMKSINPQPVSAGFKKLWNQLNPADSKSRLTNREIVLNNRVIEKLEIEMKLSLQEPLIQYNDGGISIGDFLEAQRKIPNSNRTRFKTPEQLSRQIGIWIRDQLLLKEAQSQKFQKRARVQLEALTFMREQIYLHNVRILIESMKLPAAIETYYGNKSQRHEVITQHPEVAQFHTLQQYLWWQAQIQLLKNLKKDLSEIWINEVLLEKEVQRVNWQSNIKLFTLPMPAN